MLTECSLFRCLWSLATGKLAASSFRAVLSFRPAAYLYGPSAGARKLETSFVGAEWPAEWVALKMAGQLRASV